MRLLLPLARQLKKLPGSVSNRFIYENSLSGSNSQYPPVSIRKGGIVISCKYIISKSFSSRKKSPPVGAGCTSKVLLHGFCVMFFLFQLFFGKA